MAHTIHACSFGATLGGLTSVYHPAVGFHLAIYMRLCRAIPDTAAHLFYVPIVIYLINYLLLMVHCNTIGVRTPGRSSPLAIIAELSEMATAVVVTASG